MLAAENKIGVANCWDEVMQHQKLLGMFGFHKIGWQAALVEAAINVPQVEKMQKHGDYMVCVYNCFL